MSAQIRGLSAPSAGKFRLSDAVQNGIFAVSEGPKAVT